MTIASEVSRPLGTMVAYGFAEVDLEGDFEVARRLGAAVLEIFPDWRVLPDPRALRARVDDLGLAIHSAHGCWGGKSIRATRVDLGSPELGTHRESVEDLKRCVDWLHEVGGACLVVHPGGLSDPAQTAPRRAALAGGLIALADHSRDTGVVLCVENMPPGVHPGSRMVDLAALITDLGRPELALALDTGHARIVSDPHSETVAAGPWLRTTHVHDNNGRQDSHLPPGQGSIDWDAWARSLEMVGYRGPIMLECIRHLRNDPECIDDAMRELLGRMTAIAKG